MKNDCNQAVALTGWISFFFSLSPAVSSGTNLLDAIATKMDHIFQDHAHFVAQVKTVLRHWRIPNPKRYGTKRQLAVGFDSILDAASQRIQTIQGCPRWACPKTRVVYLQEIVHRQVWLLRKDLCRDYCRAHVSQWLCRGPNAAVLRNLDAHLLHVLKILFHATILLGHNKFLVHRSQG